MRKLSLLIFIYLILPTEAYSKIIFESAVGPFNAAGCCGGSSINASQYIGSIFTLEHTFLVDSIGGNFNNIPISPSFASSLGLGGEIFGAIVNLNDAQKPLVDEKGQLDVIAKNVFTPLSEQDTSTPLQAILQPGSYGLIFGSGLFGANGKTTLTLLQPGEVVSTSGQIVFKNINGEWVDLGEAPRYRMFINGNEISAVPEVDRGFMFFMGLQVLMLLRVTRYRR